jgi:hypothetical protein
MTSKTYPPHNIPMIDRRETVVRGGVRAGKGFAS